MSIASVRELTGASASLNDQGERTYTRIFQVITTSALVSAATILLSAGIPRLGDMYIGADEIDSGAFVKSITPQQDSDNPRVWEVQVEYDSSSEPDQEENPVARPTEISWGFAQFQRLADKDINGKALLNSAGNYFDPPPEIDDSRPTLVITRNEAAFSASLAIDYQDAVNEDSFMGFDAGQVKVASISASRQFENNVYFWNVTYEFHFRREGWELKILDQGRYTTGGVPIPERREGGGVALGTHVSDPVPLNGEGQVLLNPTPDTAKFRPFKVYKERPFAAFSF